MLATEYVLTEPMHGAGSPVIGPGIAGLDRITVISIVLAGPLPHTLEGVTDSVPDKFPKVTCTAL
jgi:hypothetical protein